MSFIKYLSIATLCLFTLIAFYGPQKFLEQLWGKPDMGHVEINTLTPFKKPNTGLACPENYCTFTTPHIITGNYSAPTEKLHETIIEYFKTNKNAKNVSKVEDKLSLRFVTYSPTLRFPDTIQIQLIKLDESTSTLAIFARAKLGHSDFGANKKRIEDILATLKQFEKR